MKELITRARAVDREEGFTLVELIIAFIILALIVYAAFNLLDANITAGSVYSMKADISQELRETGSTMVDQLRTANSFTDAQSESVVFTSYITGDANLYNVQFLRQGEEIIQRINIGALSEADNKVIASNVTGLQFSYYDSTGSLLDSPSSALNSIALIKIVVTMTLTSSDNVMTDSMETMVRIRK
ncbi:MAG: prepilin-type N-terminal cleavage/methylation domain-containing protein [Actinobacteria bacterium]|nr:prepilin-type N-terminal cleavage/methylation domain-containing protein [Actinomycetota bacterium]